MNTGKWPVQKARLTQIFKTKSRDEWSALMEGTDVCFAPVLHPGEAAEHPHIKYRQIYQTIEGNIEAAPAPRFKSQSPKTSRKNSVPTNVNQILKEWGSEK
jgi:alpha-methylacyl-CoA racemase